MEVLFNRAHPSRSYNFQEPYLRAIFGFMGVTNVQFVVADSMNQGDDAAKLSRDKAETAPSRNWRQLGNQSIFGDMSTITRKSYKARPRFNHRTFPASPHAMVAGYVLAARCAR